MLRCVIPLVLLVACEAAPAKPKLDTSALPTTLPGRGFAIQTFGMGTYDALVLDEDASTLRVFIHGSSGSSVPAHEERAIMLDIPRVHELMTLAERARTEPQRPEPPAAHDIMQDLFIVLEGGAYHHRGYPIRRTYASALITTAYKLAGPTLDAMVAPKQPPAPAFRHPHAVKRAELVTPHTDPSVLPKRGVVVRTWSMGTEITIVIDRETSTLKTVTTEMSQKPSGHTRKLAPAKLDALVKAAEDAWHEDPTGPMAQATDIREDLIVLDDDEAFYLSGSPIHASGAPTGRPLASRAIELLYAAAN